MYLNKVFDKTFLKIKDSYSKSSLFADFEFKNDMLYKIDAYRVKSLEVVGDYVLSRTANFSTAGKYPSNALTIPLKKGLYAIVYKDGGIVSKTTKRMNECISMSKGEISFDELEFTAEEAASLTNENANQLIHSKNYSSMKYSEVKINGKTSLHMWVNDETAVGSLEFSIYSIDSSSQDPVLTMTTIANADTDFTFTGEVGMYELSVSEMIRTEWQEPKKKYPKGTYQITLNESISSSRNEDDLVSEQSKDIKTLDIDESTNKLNSLRSITIPRDVDPLNRYIMLGKIELNLYIDFSNDKYYLYPTTYAECFMNLFVPNMEIDMVEETDDYALYHIIDYTLIGFDFRNKPQIINNIKRWINCIDNDIHTDEYDLYYFVDTFNLYAWYYMKFKDIIDPHFIYVNVNANAYAVDDVSRQTENDEVLDYTLTACTWEKCSKTNKYNFINWTLGEWESAQTGNNNEVKMTASGAGVIRTSKKRFMNAVGVDLSTTESGALTEEQFRALKINGPIINNYSRFQYWMHIRL